MFAPAQVKANATFSDPHQYSSGMDYVIVNGVAALQDGKPTGKTPGRVLRKLEG